MTRAEMDAFEALPFRAVPDRVVTEALNAHARRIAAVPERRFAGLSYTICTAPGQLSTASIADGSTVYATARGKSPKRACELLLARLDRAVPQ